MLMKKNNLINPSMGLTYWITFRYSLEESVDQRMNIMHGENISKTLTMYGGSAWMSDIGHEQYSTNY